MTRGEIVKALRCSATVGERDCAGCPYLMEEELEGDGWEGCDVDRIALDAADLLENDENQALALQRKLVLQRAQLDCATACADRLHRQNQELRNAAALAKKPTGSAAHETVRRKRKESGS